MKNIVAFARENSLSPRPQAINEHEGKLVTVLPGAPQALRVDSLKILETKPLAAAEPGPTAVGASKYMRLKFRMLPTCHPKAFWMLTIRILA